MEVRLRVGPIPWTGSGDRGPPDLLGGSSCTGNLRVGLSEVCRERSHPSAPRKWFWTLGHVPFPTLSYVFGSPRGWSRGGSWEGLGRGGKSTQLSEEGDWNEGLVGLSRPKVRTGPTTRRPSQTRPERGRDPEYEEVTVGRSGRMTC